MRILHLTDRWITGGGQEHIFRVCEGMPQHDFVVMAAHDGPARSRFMALDNLETRTGPAAPHAVESIRPDLIHFHHLRPLLRWLCFPSRSDDAPTVVTVHGLHVRQYDFRLTPQAWILGRMRRFLEKRLLRRVGRVVAVSREDRDYMQQRYGLHNVVTIANGIAPPADDAHGADTAARWMARPVNGLVALVPARFEFQKGHDILIRALAHPSLDPLRDRIVFVLAGDGPRRHKMQRMAMKLGVDGNLRFAGDCSHATVMAMMAACDLVVLPSRWEGLPIALLEAGMRGCAVLASDACGNREILEHDRGLMFRNNRCESLAEKLAQILGEPGVLSNLGEALRVFVSSEYSLEKMLSRLERLYREELGKCAGQPVKSEKAKVKSKGAS